MRRNIVIAVVTAAALAGGGTVAALAASGDDDRDGGTVSAGDGRDDDTQDEARDDDTQGDARDDARDDDAPAVKPGDVSAADAVAAALRHTPGTAVSVDLDDDERDAGGDDDRGGRALWEVDVLAGNAWRSVRVDPGTGRVIADRAEDEDDADRTRAALKGADVSAAEAAEAVRGKGAVTSVGLDDGHDAAWEVETRDGSGWRVDPDSGKVTADRSDDD